jgi:hypothetical protein
MKVAVNEEYYNKLFKLQRATHDLDYDYLNKSIKVILEYRKLIATLLLSYNSKDEEYVKTLEEIYDYLNKQLKLLLVL